LLGGEARSPVACYDGPRADEGLSSQAYAHAGGNPRSLP